MNWTEIEKKYPKAHSLCWDYFSETEAPYGEEPFRELYDFFDKERVLVEVFHIRALKGGREVYLWGCYVWFGGICKSEDGTANHGDYMTRTEAETVAFEKAFEILEQKL